MRIHRFEQQQRLPIPLAEAWDFFASPANLDGITPPDLGFRTTSPPEPRMHAGQIITHEIRIAPFVRVTWVTEIRSVENGKSFVDEQRFGPFRFWHHRHRFEEIRGGVEMTDIVHYVLPLGWLGSLAQVLFVRRRMERIFEFRRRMLEERFGRHV